MTLLTRHSSFWICIAIIAAIVYTVGTAMSALAH